jgi:SsrA-binding protein
VGTRHFLYEYRPLAKDKPTQSHYISHGQVAENRKARFEYEITETVEAGLVLTGTEVKALRRGRANIAESYAGPMHGEIWLFNCHIGEWEGGNRNNHEPLRNRKILLKKKQASKMLGLTRIKGFTLVPLKLYFNERGFAKLLIGVGKGRKQHEKREVTKEREWNREKERLMKNKG